MATSAINNAAFLDAVSPQDLTSHKGERVRAYIDNLDKKHEAEEAEREIQILSKYRLEFSQLKTSPEQKLQLFLQAADELRCIEREYASHNSEIRQDIKKIENAVSNIPPTSNIPSERRRRHIERRNGVELLEKVSSTYEQKKRACDDRIQKQRQLITDNIEHLQEEIQEISEDENHFLTEITRLKAIASGVIIFVDDDCPSLSKFKCSEADRFKETHLQFFSSLETRDVQHSLKA
ncbi:hypothetical protein SOPP22_16070 [Shewanella sp. OPT22]|nr:hypothetical protein SOPP22_16070 [Shewanella sp. OPT22]